MSFWVINAKKRRDWLWWLQFVCLSLLAWIYDSCLETFHWEMHIQQHFKCSTKTCQILLISQLDPRRFLRKSVWLTDSFLLPWHSPWQAPAILVIWGGQGKLPPLKLPGFLLCTQATESPEDLSLLCSSNSFQTTGHMAEILAVRQLRFEEGWKVLLENKWSKLYFSYKNDIKKLPFKEKYSFAAQVAFWNG